MKKINIGIVGCGRISKKHIESILFNKDKFNLVSICDTDNNKLLSTNVSNDISKYISMEEMINNESLDVVAICTPSGLHAEHSILAARKKINVVTEKPMATKYDDALNMIKEVEINGVKLFVVKQNRYNKTLVELKKAIDEDRFGEIKMMNINVFWNRDQKYYDQDAWRGTWEFDGGALMNQASHYVDLLTWMNGPIKSLHAISKTSLNIEAEDSIILNINFENDSLGSMSVSMLAYNKNFEGSLTVIGEKGLVKVGGVAVNKIEKWEFADERDIDSKIDNISYETESVYGKGHFKYYSDLADNLNGIENEISDGYEGIKSMQTIIAAYSSAANDKIVTLPLTDF